MRDYDGPAYLKKKQSASRRQHDTAFKPTLQSCPNRAFEPKEKVVQPEQFEVPYQKKSGIELPKKDAFDALGNQPLTQQERQGYRPSFEEASETLHTKVRDAKEAQTFTPTEMPKPYRSPEESAQLDKQTRQLAKRLIKPKDSYLLFE